MSAVEEKAQGDTPFRQLWESKGKGANSGWVIPVMARCCDLSLMAAAAWAQKNADSHANHPIEFGAKAAAVYAACLKVSKELVEADATSQDFPTSLPVSLEELQAFPLASSRPPSSAHGEKAPAGV